MIQSHPIQTCIFLLAGLYKQNCRASSKSELLLWLDQKTAVLLLCLGLHVGFASRGTQGEGT